MPEIAEFVVQFAPTRDSIMHFTGVAGTPRWISIAVIHHRYVLSLSLDLTVSHTGLQAASKPEYLLREVTSLVVDAQGRPTSVEFGAIHQLSVEQWKQLKGSHWDWSTLDIKLDQNAPIQGLDAVADKV